MYLEFLLFVLKVKMKHTMDFADLLLQRKANMYVRHGKRRIGVTFAPTFL